MAHVRLESAQWYPPMQMLKQKLGNNEIRCSRPAVIASMISLNALLSDLSLWKHQGPNMDEQNSCPL